MSSVPAGAPQVEPQRQSRSEPQHSLAAILLQARRHCRIVHHLPGRLRLRIDPRGLDAALAGIPGHRPAEAFRTQLAGLAGIRGTEINLPARSVVISYDPAVLRPALWEQLIRGDPANAAAALETLLAPEPR
ncbi:MAG: hypothetical protein GVY13_01410 [Alphaproteobacteria bacterium]|jgi:hypothetical protein|nr:hypothetical protein [Alphaproteobacteria bacterium]